MTLTDSHILAIDQGTTSSRAIIFSANGDIVDVAQQELRLIYPHHGWVEQDPREILQTTCHAIDAVLRRNQGILIAGAGITNQRETTILWDRKTGESIYNAIVWQDRRTADMCEILRSQGVEEKIISKTGLLLDPYFSATKIAWILQNVEGVAERARKGEILFGTPDCYLLWHLRGGRVHATDVTNASRTMLYNVVDGCWDNELLEIFGVPPDILPAVQENIFDFGQISTIDSALNIRIGGVAGDQQAALIGQGCFAPGMIKSTYGTGCFALMNIGHDFVVSRSRLLTTVAYKIGGKVTYAAEGSIFNAGTAIQYLRDNLGFFEKSSKSEELAISVTDNGGVYFVPAFTGLGAPYWNPSARGMIYGLGRDSTKAHITRAALEAQAYQTYDLFDAMYCDTGHAIEVLRIDGGLVANRFMCQFLADILQLPVEVPRVMESTAWGAACLAGLQAGLFDGVQDIAQKWRSTNIYTPKMDAKEAARLYAGWQNAVAMLLRRE